MIFIIFIINIPRVSFDTARFTGRVQVVPTAGTVCHGTGTVWENPTRGLPILNPINCITGRGIYCAYPYHTLKGHVVVNASVVTTHFFNMTNVLHKYIIKYTKRGFTFQINPVIYLSSPCTCKHANYCPHTVHHIFDLRGLVVAYNSTTHPSIFLHNKMRKIWRGRMLTVWAFGGPACNVEQVPPRITDGFLSEIPL
jgi:hypothetical protein